jgi:hypothetical protein
VLDTYSEHSPSNPVNQDELEPEKKEPKTLLECFEHYNETDHERPLLDLFEHLKLEVEFLIQVAQVGNNSVLKNKLKKLKNLL